MSVERNGAWIDESGACKVCDGEIPYGHTSICDIYKLERSLEFYKRRCDELQKVQSKMRDPERQVVCDILANGCPRDWKPIL